MTIKTILVCLTSEASAESLLTAAAVLARRHDAHLIGLHTVETLMVYPAIAMHVPDAIFVSYSVSQTGHADALKAIFDRHTHTEDFVSEWRLIKSENQPAADRIVESARCADLVVMAAAGSEGDSGAQIRMLETVIRECGRPVIVVPTGFNADTLGRSVLIGWNGTREATRAAHDTLGLLQDGDQAHILRVNDNSRADENDFLSSDLAAAFARHGITTTVMEKSWESPGVATALSKVAFENGADLIAIGAFGHSRAYDFVIGTATRDLLKHAGLPVMFSR